MIKETQAAAILIVALAAGMILFPAEITITSRLTAYAQNESLVSSNNTMTATMQMPNTTVSAATNNATAIDTFSAEGTIGSLILTNMTLLSPSSNNATNVTATTPASVLPAKTFVLNGYWQLKVDNGNVTSFVARFTKVHLDATNRHTHEIANFTSNNNASVNPNVNGTTLISGISDVALNNITVWSKVNTTIIVNDLSTITISLDPSTTSNHFNGQSIYGIVYTLKGKSGN
jgi:hypothetical protein